jgi:hypothetical protein
MSNNSYDHENKVNLKTLEGIDEVFTDKLEEIGVLDLATKESVKYGTYENNFTCLQADKAETDDCDVETKIIDAKFYEHAGTTMIKVVTIFDSDGDVSDREIYWFDSEGNDIPSNNSNWENIMENMDIFLDDM